MIDSTVQVDDKKLVIETIIAEGGFGYVYKVRDSESHKFYALKKINSSDQETMKLIEEEIKILESLQKHPHIMEFLGHSKAERPTKEEEEENHLGTKGSYKNRYSYTYMILCEFCDRGTLTDLELPIKELERSCRIIYQTASALEHMHNMKLTHRDIKAENILFDNRGFVKLCDFGSVLKETYEPDDSWDRRIRTTVEEEMARFTTPMYRPPEILDLYSGFPINWSMDIWALGCLIYFMRFGQHAFPDSGRLSIINCHYKIPNDLKDDDFLVHLIKLCLQVDPRQRISCIELKSFMEQKCKDMDLKGTIVPFIPHQPKSKAATDVESTTTATSEIPKNNYIHETCEIFEELKTSDEPKKCKTPPKIFDTLETLKTLETGTLHTAKKDREPHECLIDLEIESSQKPLSPTVNHPRNTQGGHPFDDLLESFGSSKDNRPLTYNQLNNDEGFGIDPRSRINDWKVSRRGNIRALLSSLHTVLTEEFRWKPIGMHQLVTDADVKKIYRLACLAVHPDKVTNCDDDTKEMANMIFTELNEAWSRFEGR